MGASSACCRSAGRAAGRAKAAPAPDLSPMCSWQSRQGPPRVPRLRRVQLWGFPAPVRCDRPGESRIGAMQGGGARRGPSGCPAASRLHCRRRPALVPAGRGVAVAPCGSCCSASSLMRGSSQVRMRIREPAGNPPRKCICCRTRLPWTHVPFFHFGHAPPAAGNGVYACSQARALTQLGHEVLVVAGAPPGHAPAAGSAGQEPPLAAQVLHVSGGPCCRWCGLFFACETASLHANAAAAPLRELSMALRLLLQLCICSV